MSKFSKIDIEKAMKNVGEASANPILIKRAKELAKQREEGGRFSVSDIEAAIRSLSKKKKPDFTQKNKGGLQEGLEKLKAKGLKDGSKDVVKNKDKKKKKKKKKFPDLNKDGKVTFKDILIGRGVLKANKGTMVQARGCGMARKKKTKMF
tara:strand:- start:4129 stop:4578 length:450 start_codon:yes stop_codon:yes gene_type:complete